MNPARRFVGLLLAVAVSGAVLSGCSRPVPMDAGPSAADPRCSDVLVALPPALGDRELTETTAQATAAWVAPGSPPTQALTLTCGVSPPEPSTDVCTTVGDVDWVTTEHGDRIWHTTYGRSPAVRVSVPVSDQDGTDAALTSLAGAVRQLPAERSCS